MARKRFEMLLTYEQDQLLEEKTIAAGFFNKSEYVRYILFMNLHLADKIDAIYNKVVQDAK